MRRDEYNTQDERDADLDHAVARYRACLDAGDMRGVAQVLHEAIEDTELDRRITEINREAEREMDEEFRDEAKPRLYPQLRLPGEDGIYDPEDLVW